MPTVPREKILEAESRPLFEQAVSPWLVTQWLAHDYGIDALVEITLPKPSGSNFTPTSKRFAVQLKATEEAFEGSSVRVRVRPSQIQYWLASTEPVLLAVCHVPTREFVWRWVTSALVEELTIRDPAWVGQETVTVLVPTTSRFDDASRKEVANAVCNFSPTSPRALSPGTYRRLQSTLGTIARKVVESADAAGLLSVSKRLGDLEAALRKSTYVVAITGPARVGKSTLLNALVGRNVSPIGKLPTTAVSLMVVAGDRDEAEVSFVDGEPILGEASATFLSEFATLEQNPHNRKRVRMVTVRLVNELLEHGVAYVDAPGLHDPSPAIREVTQSALQNAHAILYVLDVSPARDGGFSLASYHLDDLERLRTKAERLFLVLNKADALNEEERVWVAAHVEERLREYGLWDALPQPPLFVSASVALADKSPTLDGPISLQPLHAAVWDHLLSTNETGIGRISVAVTELGRASSELLSLISVRRLDGKEAFRLREALRSCKQREVELLHDCRARAQADDLFAQHFLRDTCEELARQLRSRLDQIPIDQPLPKEKVLEAELRRVMIGLITDIWSEIMARFQVFSAHISQEVEKSLHQARLTSGPVSDRFVLPHLPALKIPADSFEEAWTGLFAGGLLAAIVGGPNAWLIAAVGWLAGLAVGRESQRKRQIDKIVGHVESALEDIKLSVVGQVQDKIRLFARSLDRHVRDRISIFVHDVEAQLARLGEPLSPDEQARFGQIEQTVRDTLSTLALVCDELEVPLATRSQEVA